MLSSNRLPQTMLSSARFPHTRLSPAKALPQATLTPSIMPIRRSPHTTLLAQTAASPQTRLLAFVIAKLPQTIWSPQMIVVDHAELLWKRRSPQTTLLPQTTFFAHTRAVAAMMVCVGTELRSHHSPSRAEVSIALLSAIAPCALISPAPCVRTSYGTPASSRTGIALYSRMAFTRLGVSLVAP